MPRRELGCVVESTMLHQIHLEKIEPVEPEPLISERIAEATRPRVIEQPCGLCFQHLRLGQLSFRGQLPQFRIGLRSPEKIGKSRCQFDVRQGTRLCFQIRFGEIEKHRRGQHNRQAVLERRHRMISRAQSRFIFSDQPINELRSRLLSAEGLPGKQLERTSHGLKFWNDRLFGLIIQWQFSKHRESGRLDSIRIG